MLDWIINLPNNCSLIKQYHRVEIKELFTGYQQDQKKKNIARILEIAHETKGISRIDVAKELDIDRSTVTTIVPELIKNGILRELRVEPNGKGGRPPILLQIKENFGYTIGIAIHLTNFIATVLDLNGNVVQVFKEDLPYTFNQFTRNCIAILQQTEKVMQTTGIPIIGAVIAISGIIDPKKNRIDRSFVFQLEDFDFQKEIADHFRYPLFVENDANACAWGELFPPWNRKFSSFLYLLARTTKFNIDSQVDTGMGIGMGVVIDGRIIHGSHYQAGELRSVYLKTACETENQVSIPQFRLAHIQHDKTVLKELVREVLINLIPITSVLDPEAIIFGGDIKGKIDVIHEVLQESLSDTFLASEQSKYAFVASNKGDNEVSTGAASLFLYRLFKQPQDESELSEKASWEQIFKLTEI